MQHPIPDRSVQPRKLTIGVLYGFRALMVLLVCNYHIWQQSWLPQYFLIFGMRVNLDFLARAGFLFVDGMLLMSGLLLYLPYAREKEEGIPVPEVKQFYGNRLVRILPSYLLAVALAFFLIALPQNIYPRQGLMVKDILTHLTFTFNFWRETCLHTPLNGALWTVAVEMQFYLIFPLLARAAQKKPGWTLGLMGLVGMGYRVVVYTQVEDSALLLNQMPSFMDVYALGMLGAMLYVRLRRVIQEKPLKGTFLTILPWLAAWTFVLSLAALGALLRAQAASIGFEGIRQSQMALRLPFALTILCAMLSAALMPRFLQKLLDNRLMRFLATISFNLYIWHQVLAVQIRMGLFPDTLHSDRGLQWIFTLLCYSVSIIIAMIGTYGVEQPSAKLAGYLQTHRRKKNRERSETIEA